VTDQTVENDVTATAAADAASVRHLVRELVRAPSRGGRDDYRPVVDVVTGWLRDNSVAHRVLTGPDAMPLAVAVDVQGHAPGRHVVLDACLDTADLGDVAAWSRDPFSGDIDDQGWLHGRGAADSKAAAAIFCHVAGHLAADPGRFTGTASVLLDLDEHTGGFGGIRAYLAEQTAPVDGVMIGYPGPEKIVVGGRGFHRTRITVYGQAGHTASRTPTTSAVTRAVRLATALEGAAPVDAPQPFGLPPRITVTAIHAGTYGQFSVTPDRAVLEVDARLTPTWTSREARRLLAHLVEHLDSADDDVRACDIAEVTEPWPAFQLAADHPLPRALATAATAARLTPTPVVAGPSNIGCYLAAHGIPATAGFGVAYRGLHGIDEAIDLATVPAVQATYHRAVLDLLEAS
jgi:succinyl-diaminopimelate desuccinylase